MSNMIFVSVVDNTVQIVVQDKSIITWIQDSLESYKKASDPKMGMITMSRISVDGFKDSKNAMRYASRFIRFLTSNGWREVSYNDYVCGHWYRKK